MKGSEVKLGMRVFVNEFNETGVVVGLRKSYYPMDSVSCLVKFDNPLSEVFLENGICCLHNGNRFCLAQGSTETLNHDGWFLLAENLKKVEE